MHERTTAQPMSHLALGKYTCSFVYTKRCWLNARQLMLPCSNCALTLVVLNCIITDMIKFNPSVLNRMTCRIFGISTHDQSTRFQLTGVGRHRHRFHFCCVHSACQSVPEIIHIFVTNFEFCIFSETSRWWVCRSLHWKRIQIFTGKIKIGKFASCVHLWWVKVICSRES